MTNRIAIFLPSLGGGGAERVNLTIANALAERGFSVDLVLVSAFGPYLNEVLPSVRVIDLKSFRVAASLPNLISYLRQEKPEAMLSAMGYANVIALLARKFSKTKTRVVVSEHSTFSISKSNARTLRGHLVGHLMRYEYPKAAGIVAVSKGVAEDLATALKISRDDIDVVYNPVVTNDLISKSYADPNHPWLVPGQPPVILGVGRLNAAKDFSLLIKAFRKLTESYSARLIILGEGALRSELESLISNQRLQGLVDMPGFAENPFAYMRSACMFVLSSRWEGLPSVLIEAMACGTPVVSTDCPSGPREILENGKWGRLVPVNDESALAEAMLATLKEDQHPDVTERARDFGLEQAIKEYLRVLLKP